MTTFTPKDPLDCVQDHAQRFGHESVLEESKDARVQDVFHSVAPQYNVMNDIMSLGLHRLWKQRLIQQLAPLPGMHLLDMASGTADIATLFLKHTQSMDPSCYVTLCDRNTSMLENGRDRLINHNLLDQYTIVCGDAESIPALDNSFDAYTISFGLRNVTHLDKVLREALRVLKPDGKFLCLEFSRLPPSTFKRAYDSYATHLIPKIGEWIGKDRGAYQYLSESIDQFLSAEELKALMKEVGFTFPKVHSFVGGLLSLHAGLK